MKKLLGIVLMLMLVFSLVGCGSSVPTEKPKPSFETASKANEESVQNLVGNDSLPQISRSLERENIKRRVEFINQADNVGYLYLLSESGALIEEIQVLGKISSLNSYLTPMEEVQWFRQIDLGESRGDVPVVISAPDLDGTWGENAQGVFWFDMGGEYGEWNGLYRYSSKRLTYSTPTILINVE